MPNITISRGSGDDIQITLKDGRNKMLWAEMTPENFGRAVTGMSEQPMELIPHRNSDEQGYPKPPFDIKNWMNDAVHFPRLLAALVSASNLSDEQIHAAAEAMETDYQQVTQLFARASTKWEQAEAKLLASKKDEQSA